MSEAPTSDRPGAVPMVRRFDAGDAAAVAALCGELGYPSTPDDVVRRAGGAEGGDPGAHALGAVFVAVVAGRVAGFIEVQVVATLTSDPFVEIAGLVVTAACRGRGAGRRLVAAGEDWARTRGIASLRVRSRTTREDAHAFYRALGYAPYKSQVVFARTLEARTLDASTRNARTLDARGDGTTPGRAGPEEPR